MKATDINGKAMEVLPKHTNRGDVHACTCTDTCAHTHTQTMVHESKSKHTCREPVKGSDNSQAPLSLWELSLCWLPYPPLFIFFIFSPVLIFSPVISLVRLSLITLSKSRPSSVPVATAPFQTPWTLYWWLPTLLRSLCFNQHRFNWHQPWVTGQHKAGGKRDSGLA